MQIPVIEKIKSLPKQTEESLREDCTPPIKIPCMH